MKAELSQILDRYADGHYQPVTFLDRGVAIPFTTPILLSARARPTDRGLELILSNPSGGVGHYVIPWHAMPEVCSPSLHDRKLFEQVSRLNPPTPAAIKAAARDVAREGWAGKAAAQAATDAHNEEQRRRLLTHFQLLLRLTRQVEGPGASPPIESDSRANQQARAKAALGRVATRFQVSPEQVPAWLEQVATIYAEHGVGDLAADAPTPRRMRELKALADAVTAHARVTSRPEEASCADLVSEAAQLTLRSAQEPVARIEAMLNDIPDLVMRMGQDPRSLFALAAQPDWLLDGWTTIHDLWSVAPPAWRGHALAEMADLIPVIPREVRDWSGDGSEWSEAGSPYAAMARRHRYVLAREDWRSGRMMDLMARNERLRALRP
jgi:hypothetical protein